MSQQGPLIVVAREGRPAFADVLAEQGAFPIVEATWEEAIAAFTQIFPALIVADVSDGCTDDLIRLASSLATAAPYVPLIAVGTLASPPPNVIPFEGPFGQLPARVNAALRVRTLHATVLRRLDDATVSHTLLPPTDPIQDATALLVGRGPSYPALSVAFGQRMGVIGALSVEAAANHLNIRDIDGVILGEGFSPRVADAFLTVLSEDSRFRHLPVIVSGNIAGIRTDYGLANLEVVRGSAPEVAANAVPLIRQHALEARLTRALKSLDADGLLDPRTGLLTVDAFDKDFSKAVSETAAQGGGLSAARFVFQNRDVRAAIDAARILSRLMRRMDFAALQEDGSIIAAFSQTDLRTAHVIARRLASVLKHTMLSADESKRLDPQVTLATLKANDSAEAVLERLQPDSRRAAS